MAGVVLSEKRPDLTVETAGTLTVDGMPISFRTRAALDDVGMPWPQHRSHQAGRADLHAADVIVALAPEHVQWVRREHPEVGARTGTLIRLTKQLSTEDRSLSHRVASLDLGGVELEDWEEVVDPGGGEVETFVECARQIVVLVDRLAELL
jgi:protein-tyrosine-phosphatase